MPGFLAHVKGMSDAKTGACFIAIITTVIFNLLQELHITRPIRLLGVILLHVLGCSEPRLNMFSTYQMPQ